MTKKSETLKNAFWQLLVVYTIAVVLISLSLVWKYTLHFEIFAVVIAVLGAIGLYHVHEKEGVAFPGWLKWTLLVLALVLIVGLRVIPYFGNSIPLGYDAGIYKYGIENFASEGFGADEWVMGAFTPGFLYLMWGLVNLGVSSFALLTWVYILFGLLLGLGIYFFTKEYLGGKAAVIAVLLYAVSGIQFKLFSYLYYKNVIALSLLLFALYFLKRSRLVHDSHGSGRLAHDSGRSVHGSHSHRLAPKPALAHDRHHPSERKDRNRPTKWDWNGILFVVFGILVGLMHRPTFFLFGVAYISYVLTDWKNFTRNFVDGVVVLIAVIVGYAGFWESLILPLFVPVAESFVDPGTAPGTFVSFFVYQFSTLYYLPFAILGFLYMAWRKKYDMLFFMTLIAGVIVYFQFFFFNRFIAHLDVFLIVLAGAGFALLIDNWKKLGGVILGLMLISAGFVAVQDAVNARPLITQQGLELIEMIDSNTPEGASVMALSSEYSPWVVGYSNRETIAPGLFDANKWSEEEWGRFWQTNSEEETRELMSVYSGDVYLFAGTKSFNNPCFEEFLTNGGNKLYRYNCNG